MTGAVILVKKGNQFILFRVWQSGYDVLEYFGDNCVTNIPFEQQISKYREWR